MLGDVKIFITYHKPSVLLTDLPLVIPIHGGRALRTATKDGDFSESDMQWLLENMIGDDTGDNISLKNREYCELTALYWVYKNFPIENCSHIGFMQYRRHFIFNEKEFEATRAGFEEEAFSIKRYERIDQDYLQAISFSEKIVLQYINNYDCIVPYAGNLSRAGVKSIWHDYAQQIPGMHIDDMCALREAFARLYPSEIKEFDAYLSQHHKLMYLMFILRKDFFLDYCQYLFGILFNVEKEIDTSLYTPNGKRTMGFLGEILYGYYFSKLKKKGRTRIKELGVSLVNDTGVKND